MDRARILRVLFHFYYISNKYVLKKIRQGNNVIERRKFTKN